ncbi:uncharacterized protein BDR25DRAFT_16992 [Lindgomyces ingoldianus]|uniref:Uncharacterized protein n=1 Tax=Lindgomyces ingoldianus TaxID=673940 RepID=A0ACB6R0F4_9PLEO|nr:uncharacterized protein BDR25DRAFT_16992 [Lindgomyces ingoldianus]KAF2471987.1 hypothetical protein BDR25DRAFT_16992 [Lindgomyces ingoldianus]
MNEYKDKQVNAREEERVDFISTIGDIVQPQADDLRLPETSSHLHMQHPSDSACSPGVLDVKEVNQTVLEGYLSARKLSRLAIEQAHVTTKDSRGPLNREEVQRSAEQCVGLSAAKSNRRTSSRRTLKDVLSLLSQPHDFVASPAPASSIGFTYRKTAEARGKENLSRKTKPRLMMFESSPAIPKDGPGVISEDVQGNMSANDKADRSFSIRHSHSREGPRPDVYEVIVSDTGVVDHLEDERQQQDDLNSSRQSTYSTQTAMMLAQLEFQQDVFPPISCETPGAVLQSDNAPQPPAREPSPAITPFHTFNAGLNERHPPDSVLHGPPISTQDLFCAASPFAFSTVKKTKRQPQSTLRFAVLPTEERINKDAAQTNDPKSPTPSAERIPLKERNSCGSALRFGSTGPQESCLKGQRLPSIGALELPNLDLHTSLDDALDEEMDFSFTNGFLRNLDGMT